MLTLALALLAAVLLGRTFEGTVKMRPILASCTFAQVGKVRLTAWSHRPGRLYVRIGA